jgi:large subunit ribosomal protein L10
VRLAERPTLKGGDMPTEAKRAQVAELVEVFSASQAAIVSDYRGLTVTEIGKVRRELRGKGITYRVVKNRLARIAAEQAGRAELGTLLTGPSAVALGGNDEAELARGLLDAVRPYRTVVVRGAAIGDTTLDGDAVTRLAALPGRSVLLGQLAGGIASPLGTMAGLLAAPLRNLGYALAQLQEQRQQAEA